MKVLLDECVPRKIKRELLEFEVQTVTERGWSGVKNGALLVLAETEFDVFITVDQNLKYQQNLENRKIAIVMLVAKSNRLQALLPLMHEVREALKNIKTYDFVIVGGD